MTPAGFEAVLPGAGAGPLPEGASGTQPRALRDPVSRLPLDRAIGYLAAAAPWHRRPSASRRSLAPLRNLAASRSHGSRGGPTRDPSPRRAGRSCSGPLTSTVRRPGPVLAEGTDPRGTIGHALRVLPTRHDRRRASLDPDGALVAPVRRPGHTIRLSVASPASDLPACLRVTPGPGRLRRVLLDTAPLRLDRDYRWLWAGQAVNGIGTQITRLALPYQVYVLTGSTLAIAALTRSSSSRSSCSRSARAPSPMPSTGGGCCSSRRSGLLACSVALVLLASLRPARRSPLFGVAFVAAGLALDRPSGPIVVRSRASSAGAAAGRDRPGSAELPDRVGHRSGDRRHPHRDRRARRVPIPGRR